MTVKELIEKLQAYANPEHDVIYFDADLGATSFESVEYDDTNDCAVLTPDDDLNDDNE
jgi:hypothetical protein